MWDERVFPGFGRHVLQACGQAGFRARVSAALDSLAAIFIHVAEGSFISYGPPIARDLPHPGVVFIPTDPVRAIEIPVSLVWRSDSPHRDALAWLAETMALADGAKHNPSRPYRSAPSGSPGADGVRAKRVS